MGLNDLHKNPQELFNLHHASLRSLIERAFGVLKKRFPIVRSTTKPFYSCETQSNIFLACCILHNFLLKEDRDKELEDKVMHEVLNATQDEEVHAPRDADDRGEQIRDSMANEMWNEYLLPNGTFTSEAYATMAEELSKSLKKDIRKDNLQNRLRTLKLSFAKYYDVFYGASLSGFSWDPVTKLMQAEDEVWEALIKDSESAKLCAKL
ncbi:putative nuclease HARBI1 [Tanacetum coccineum]